MLDIGEIGGLLRSGGWPDHDMGIELCWIVPDGCYNQAAIYINSVNAGGWGIVALFTMLHIRHQSRMQVRVTPGSDTWRVPIEADTGACCTISVQQKMCAA